MSSWNFWFYLVGRWFGDFVALSVSCLVGFWDFIRWSLIGGELNQTHWRKTNHFLSFFSSCFFLFFDWLTGWIFGFYPLIPDWGFEISSSSLYPRHWLTDWLGGQGFRLAYLRSLQACIVFLLLFHNLNRKLLFLTSFLEFANIKTPLLSFDYERGFDLVKIAVSKFRHKSARFEQIVQFPKILFCIINCISSNVSLFYVMQYYIFIWKLEICT